MRSLQLIVGCAIASLVSGAALAAEDGIYIGAAKGRMETRHKVGLGESFDDQDSSFKVMAGWRPIDWFAVEASYFDLGDITLQQSTPGLSPFKLEQRGYDVFGIFLVEIVNFDLFAKAGAVKSAADLSVSTIAGPASSVDRDTDFAWGAGAQVRFGKLAARIEYERFEISNGDSFKPPKLISLGVTWTF